jgi:hypothetical protein
LTSAVKGCGASKQALDTTITATATAAFIS